MVEKGRSERSGGSFARKFQSRRTCPEIYGGRCEFFSLQDGRSGCVFVNSALEGEVT
jgi:hypothetical protein